MAIEFSKDRRFIGLWFVYPPAKGFPHRRADWFAASWLNPDDTLEFAYRFHYYDKPGTPSEGEGRWYGACSREAVGELDIQGHKDFMARVAGLNSFRNQSPVDWIDCNLCDGEAVIQLLSGKEWWRKSDGTT